MATCRENLSVSPAVWWMKAICVNFLLFLLLFFFTTPSLVLNLLNQGGYKKAVAELHVSHNTITNTVCQTFIALDGASVAIVACDHKSDY